MWVVGWKSKEVAQGYIGTISPQAMENRKRKRHKQAYTAAHELPILPEFAKMYAVLPRKDTWYTPIWNVK